METCPSCGEYGFAQRNHTYSCTKCKFEFPLELGKEADVKQICNIFSELRWNTEDTEKVEGVLKPSIILKIIESIVSEHNNIPEKYRPATYLDI